MYQRSCINTYIRPISYFFLFSTLGITFLALCTTYWYADDEGGVLLYYGIWSVCEVPPITGCTFLPDARSNNSEIRLTATRALFSMSIMHLLGAVGYPPFFKQMSTGVLKIGFMALLSVIAGLYSLISMVIMTYEINCYRIITYGYSYFLGWTGTGLSFLAAALIYVASKDSTYSEPAY